MREIIAAVFKTGSGSFFTLLLGTLTSKIFAVLLGPSGIGLFSLIRQTRDTFLTLTTFHGGTALVQGIASRSGRERQQYSLVVLLIFMLSTFTAVAFLWVFAPYIAQVTLHQQDSETTWLIRWLSLPVVSATGVMYIGSLLNGYRAIGRLAIVQVVGALMTLLLAFPAALLVNRGYTFAFVFLMLISSTISLITAYWFASREGWLPPLRQICFYWDKYSVKSAASFFLSFAITTLVVGFAGTWTALAVRSLIVSRQGLVAAGIFDVAWTLSMMYMTLVLSSFGTYYLPTLSQSKSISESSALINRVLRLTLILVVPLITAVIVLKPFVVKLLYSEEFLPAMDVIRWMLVGNYLKATSWIFGVTITASADKKALFWSEILWQAGFLSLAWMSLYVFNTMEGIGVAFTALYGLHLVYTFFYARVRLQYVPSKKLVLRWLLGLGILLGASINQWNQIDIDWAPTFGWLLIASLYAILSLSSQDRSQATHLMLEKIRFLIPQKHV